MSNLRRKAETYSGNGLNKPTISCSSTESSILQLAKIQIGFLEWIKNEKENSGN
ncbi:hypothetical protein ACFFMO_15155 [Lederbergia wuyishanensis]